MDLPTTEIIEPKKDNPSISKGCDFSNDYKIEQPTQSRISVKE